MAKEEAIQVEGVIKETLPNAMFRVEVVVCRADFDENLSEFHAFLRIIMFQKMAFSFYSLKMLVGW